MNFSDTHLLLAHGNGGRRMRELIDEIFARHLANPHLDTRLDATPLPAIPGEWMMTTDGFTVQPLEFPGGSIGSLAVHGTVNDLAVAGAEPRWLTLNALLEEGLEVALLDRIVADLATAARESGVAVVAGDTKILRRGEGGGIYLATTGVGERRRKLTLDTIQPGDALVVSGPVGDHGIAVMLAREQFGLHGDLRSDSASVLPLARAAWAIPEVRFLRDPTRGGLATVTHELARLRKLDAHLRQAAIPVREPVASVCEMLGYDPLYLACEGRVVAVVGENRAEHLVQAWRELPGGDQTAIIGRLESAEDSTNPRVILHTALGGQRLLMELEDDPLPRIC